MAAKIRINLRDWRTEKRARRQKQFVNMAALSVIAVAAAVGLVWTLYNGAIGHQKARNDLLKAEIAKIDEQIKEIQNLEQARARLIARMEVIEKLQGQRSQVVHFFDEIIKTLPEGVFLTSLSESSGNVKLVGQSESNARISSYMKQLDASEYFTNPRLVVIQTSGSGNVRSSNFTLEVKHIAPKKSDDIVEDEEA